MQDTAEILKDIAMTFAYISIHPDDVEKFFNLYVDLKFPTHRHSKEWALHNLKIDYERMVSNINKQKEGER